MLKADHIYDVLIIGAGQAGVPLAREFAKQGRTVAVAERKHLGGSCVNFGCTPTKTVIASARVAHLARRAADFGVIVPNIGIDYPKVLARARAIVEASKRSLARGLDECGADVMHGHYRFIGQKGGVFCLCAGREQVSARQVVINTGTRTSVPPIDGLHRVDYLHAGNWLDQDSLPEHVVFAGAGFIALEMAQFYRRMGSRVTVVASGARVVEHEDEDISAALQKLLADEDICFRLQTKVTAVSPTINGVRLIVSSNKTGDAIEASHVFVATGRKPNTDDLGLETIGLTIREDGTIEVDDRTGY